MKILQYRNLNWWQVGILKLSLLFVGISLGVYWQEIFLPYAGFLLSMGLMFGTYIAYLRFRKPSWRHSFRLMFFF